MTAIVVVILFAVLVDGIKMIVESFAKRKERSFTFDPSQVTAVIACYNEEGTIRKTLEDLKKILPESQIIVVDDCSKDQTSKEVADSSPLVKLIRQKKNTGKAMALKRGLEEVKTPFVLILDADLHLNPDFALPTSALTEKTASAFNVMPYRPDFKAMSLAARAMAWILFQFQCHEYAKSMQIGRRSQDTVDSVHCISGAAGFFQTERLKKLSKFHSGVFPAEDLERTLIELAADGKVIFTDQKVETDVPLTLSALVKQRVIGWWPGLYRTMPLFFKILFKPKSHLKLRFEMLYEIFSLFTDSLKIYSLVYLFMQSNWPVLLTVYVVYLVMEAILYLRIRDRYLDAPTLVISLYIFYNTFQMFLRVLAFPVFVWKKIITGKWKSVQTKIALTLAVLVIMGSVTAAYAEEKKSDWKNDCKYEYVSDSNGRNLRNLEVFLGYKDQVYLDLKTGLETGRFDWLVLGNCFNLEGFFVNPEVRVRSNDWTAKCSLERLLVGPFVGQLIFSDTLNSNMEQFPMAGSGFYFYFGDYHYFYYAMLIHSRGISSTAKLHLETSDRNWWWNIATDEEAGKSGKPGIFTQLGFRMVYVEFGYYRDFDYQNFNRMVLGSGIKINF